MTREEARALDAADPLASARERFHLPAGRIYLDGNSLGALPRATSARIREIVERQWGDDLIGSWNEHGWIDWPLRIGEKLAPIVGAAPAELLIADSTSVCLFKALGAAIAASPDRRVILGREGDFPTDHYVAQGLAALHRDVRFETCAAETIEERLNDDVAVLVLSHVDYRGGQRLDMGRINAAARRHDVLAIWDLSHSAGAMVVDLARDGCDLAVGCGYKYLNGGPGAPAFLFVAERLQERLQSPIWGWMGHGEPFAFASDYRAAAGIRKFLTGTPSIIALSALEAGLDSFAGVEMAQVEAKSRQLCGIFVEEIERSTGIDLSTQRDRTDLGSHVVVPHEDAYAIMQALISRGVIGDFREPNLMRFGFAPLYNRFEEAWEAARTLSDILAKRDWDHSAFRERKAVT